MPAVSVALARPGNRRLIRVITVLAAVLTFVALLLVGGPASAHDRLLSSDPEDGATLDEHPATISLTFSAAPLDAGIEIVLAGPDGTTAQGHDIQVDDEVVTARLDEGLPPGRYDVAWHVVSSDGHPIDGELSYVVEAPAEPTQEPSDEPTTEPETPEAEATDAALQELAPATELAGAGDGAGPSGLAVTGGILAAVLVVLGVVVMMRRKILENDRLRRASEPEETDSDAEKPNENPDDKPKG
jgi:methionine-rich copper-binding protein CopC